MDGGVLLTVVDNGINGSKQKSYHSGSSWIKVHPHMVYPVPFRKDEKGSFASYKAL